MKILCLAAIMILIPLSTFARPFLVCNFTGEVIEKYVGKVDGTPFETIFSLHPSGVPIIYDLGPLDLTKPHAFSDIRACNVMGCSDPAVSFESPTIPKAPLNLKFLD